MSPDRIVFLVVGPTGHGVTDHARALARATPTGRIVRLGADGPPTESELAAAAAGARIVHVHVTDRLFGRAPAELAAAMELLAGHCPLSVTLHDLPQPSDGEHFARRAEAYRRVREAATLVQVCSETERRLLVGLSQSAAPVRVVPLPIPWREGAAAADLEPPTPRPGEVGVLGYLYPGKGHDWVLDQLGQLRRSRSEVPWRLRVLGRPSAGHEYLLRELQQQAHHLGVGLHVTGFVPEVALDAELRRVAIPVAAHRHLSASGSIHRWIAAGRRPIVSRSAYAEELLDRWPWALMVVDDAQLGPAIATVQRSPDRSWIDPRWRQRAPWGVSEAAQAQLRAIREEVGQW